MSIDKHEWFDDDISHSHNSNSGVFIDVEYDQWGGHLNGYSKEDKTVMFNKSDTIALAKHFNLTAEDLNCTKLKDKQAEIDKADELHFDECAELQQQIKELNNKLLMKERN